MVLLTLTPTINAALARVPSSARDELRLPPPVGEVRPDCSISHTQVIQLAKCLRQGTGTRDDENHHDDDTSRSHVSLNSLLRGTQVYRSQEASKTTEKTPEYLALKARLLAAQEERAYREMLSPTSSTKTFARPNPIFNENTRLYSASYPQNPSSTGGVGDDEEDLLSPSVVLNILVSVLFTGFATFWALTHFRADFLMFVLPGSAKTTRRPEGAVHGQEQTHLLTPAMTMPARVFVSLFVGIVVGVAEVGVYAAYLRKVTMAKEKERKLVERKEVVSLPFPADESTATDGAGGGATTIATATETEEIWGKGMNGGVRRRVRERWRKENEQNDQSGGGDGDVDGADTRRDAKE